MTDFGFQPEPVPVTPAEWWSGCYPQWTKEKQEPVDADLDADPAS